MAAITPQLKFDGEALGSFQENINWTVYKPPLIYPMTEFTDPRVIHFVLRSKHGKDFVVGQLWNRRIEPPSEQGEQSMYSVDDSGIIDSLRTKLGLFHTERYLTEDCQWSMLQRFGFQNHPTLHQLDVEFKLRDGAVLVVGFDRDVEKALRLINKFSKGVCKETVNLRSDQHLELLQNENGDRNLNVLSYFRETLARKRMECHVEFEVDQNTGRFCVCLYYPDNVRSKKLKDVIRGCIDDHIITSDQMERLQTSVNELFEKGKMKVVRNTKKTVLLICTSDITFKLNDKLQEYTCYMEDINVPFTISNSLGNHGKESQRWSLYEALSKLFEEFHSFKTLVAMAADRKDF